MEDDTAGGATSHQKTVLLVNTFVINTVRLLNKFAKQCELKLDKVNRRILEVEYTVSMLEQRLSCFEAQQGVDQVPAAAPEPQPSEAAINEADAPGEPTVEEAATEATASPEDADELLEEATEEAPPAEEAGAPTEDDPDYGRFLKMRRVRP
eukprot:scaffold1293_cov375-Prasinococcus_capsulatus_cf.AAC.5